MSASPPADMTLHAPAKVNLCLAVSYPPYEGYHALESVFQALDVHDDVELSVMAREGAHGPRAFTAAGTCVCLSCDTLAVATCDNLAFKAVEAYERHVHGAALVDAARALVIRIHKRIPPGGGLGGGSSDAAAVLGGCALLAGASPGDERVMAAARSLGADVAFFLQGGACLMSGRGDVRERELEPFPLPLVLLGDGRGNATRDVYVAFDAAPAPAPDARALAREMQRPQPDARRLAALCGNNLEPAACELSASLACRLARARADEDVLAAHVTGSGSTCFAVCADERRASAFARRAGAYSAWSVVAHALPPSP